jgi:uncharacterized protein (TIGR02611 family)
MKRDIFKHLTYSAARRVVVAVTGGTVIVIGVLMIFLPGPAMVVIPAGLGILGLEFAWARRWLRKIKKQVLSQLQTDTKGNSSRATKEQDR